MEAPFVLLTADGKVLCPRVVRPRGFWQRHLGLLARAPLAQGEGLWLQPCGSVHTWGVRQRIDLLFLDPEHRVLRWVADVPPWRVVTAPRGTASVVELATRPRRIVPAVGCVLSFKAASH